jgi:hypothetical protein
MLYNSGYTVTSITYNLYHSGRFVLFGDFTGDDE